MTETVRTLDILAENGIEYTGNWVNDEQPYPMKVKKGSMISMPYSSEINDIPALLSLHQSPERFGQMICDQFDVLYEDGLTTGRVMSICLHKHELKPGAADYLLEIVDDPRGVVETADACRTTRPSPGEPVTQMQKITKDALKFTAQFAKRYYFTTLRFGIIESTGGVGADLHFFNDTLDPEAGRLQLLRRGAALPPPARHAARPGLRPPLRHRRAWTTSSTPSVRDPATNRLIAGRDFFFGGGVYFTDDDLKAILPSVPAALARRLDLSADVVPRCGTGLPARRVRADGSLRTPMSLLVVGSVALDSVETPFGKKEDVLGGSATFFSTAASFFTPVQRGGGGGRGLPRGAPGLPQVPRRGPRGPRPARRAAPSAGRASTPSSSTRRRRWTPSSTSSSSFSPKLPGALPRRASTSSSATSTRSCRPRCSTR